MASVDNGVAFIVSVNYLVVWLLIESFAEEGDEHLSLTIVGTIIWVLGITMDAESQAEESIFGGVVHSEGSCILIKVSVGGLRAGPVVTLEWLILGMHDSIPVTGVALQIEIEGQAWNCVADNLILCKLKERHLIFC